ncbi:hypothetical protein [Capnocytophaga cynodegmi]|uniref:hypothetical protein n=1 Tax=Capnocytophaga cynodegmi TaxID=28189 RepID=UPI001BB45F54|nr:hypothetical protein [Capnocytophaga cynodegmi]
MFFEFYIPPTPLQRGNQYKKLFLLSISSKNLFIPSDLTLLSFCFLSKKLQKSFKSSIFYCFLSGIYSIPNDFYTSPAGIHPFPNDFYASPAGIYSFPDDFYASPAGIHSFPNDFCLSPAGINPIPDNFLNFLVKNKNKLSIFKYLSAYFLLISS